MILAQSGPQRDAALVALEPEQRADFAGLLSVMAGLPVTIRLLDPPLHEFLPAADDALEELSEVLEISPEEVRDRIRALHEANPMLGHRGSRLAVTAPEIYPCNCALCSARCRMSRGLRLRRWKSCCR